MNNQLNEFITAMGALAEMLRLFREELLKNGFTREETLKLVEAFMLEQIKQKPTEEK